MGLLDDAIREHLDLKRRRGADPAEVERAEREALGPVRRGLEEPEVPEPENQEPLAYDHAQEQDWGESFDEPGNGVAYHEADEPQTYEHSEPHLADEAPPRHSSSFLDFEDRATGAGGFEESSHPSGDFSDEPPTGEHHVEEHPPAVEPFDDVHGSATPAPHAAPASEPAERPGGGETVEYEVEAALEQEGREKPADDMLEETPDFLQDTPDHDRLWFEQRPPRDFDFEG